MFDFSWSEIVLIGGVALVLIGPKDLPIAMRSMAGFVKKARGMAGEFQGHVDQMLREADLTEARDTFRQMRRFDVRGQVMTLLDDDGSLRRSVREATLPPGSRPLPIAAAPVSAAPVSPLPPLSDGSAVDTAPGVSLGSTAPAPVANDGFGASAVAPAPIPPSAAREIVRRAMPRPAFLPPGSGRSLY